MLNKLVKAIAKAVAFIMLVLIIIMATTEPVKAQTAVADSGTFSIVSVGTASWTASGTIKNTDTTFLAPISYPAQYDSNYTIYFKCSGDTIKVKFVLQEYACGTWNTIRNINDSLKVSTLTSKKEIFSNIARLFRYAVIGLPGVSGSAVNGYKTSYKIESRFKRFPY